MTDGRKSILQKRKVEMTNKSELEKENFMLFAGVHPDEDITDLELSRIEKIHSVHSAIGSAIVAAMGAKPNDRSPVDRKFAILITDLEKCEAYCKAMV